MIEAIVVIIFLLVVGIPIGKTFGFVFNPFWSFTNYRRIKNNPTRTSDFYNSTKPDIIDEISISMAPSEIPKPNIKYEIAKEKAQT
jgi:hypothetical protein